MWIYKKNLAVIFFNFYYYFFNFWLRWVFVAVHRLSLVAVSRGYSSLWSMGFSLPWLLLLQSTGSRCTGFSSCGARAQQLWHTGLVAPRHVGTSQTRARTRVPCIGRRILNRCATREVRLAVILIAIALTVCEFKENQHLYWVFQSMNTIFLHLFRSSLISFTSVLQFSKFVFNF